MHVSRAAQGRLCDGAAQIDVERRRAIQLPQRGDKFAHEIDRAAWHLDLGAERRLLVHFSLRNHIRNVERQTGIDLHGLNFCLLNFPSEIELVVLQMRGDDRFSPARVAWPPPL